MKKILPRSLGRMTIAQILFLATVAGARAQTPSTVQSTVRPLGLNIAQFVMQAGSDTASANFQQSTLPSINQLLSTRISEQTPMNDSAFLLDPSRLSLRTESDIRVYFVGEGAGYHNTLGFTLTANGQVGSNPTLIFPDASSPISAYDPAPTAVRTGSMPLLPGDFVNLGTASAGSKLDFFLISNGANGGKSTFGTVAANNPDFINHVVAFAITDSPYLILGFEDWFGGGDRDFNDVLIAVNIGVRNVGSLTGAPEPSLALLLPVFIAMALCWRSRTATLKEVAQV